MSLRTNIITVLRSRHCSRINFNTGAVRINGADYSRIARCVENGQIQVVRSSSVPSSIAIYNKRFNCFVIGSSFSNNLIVHEATHAINDMHRQSIIDVDDEVCAYLAQMIYLFTENPGLQRQMQQPQTIQHSAQAVNLCRTDAQYCNTAAIGLASGIAISFLAGRRIDRTTLLPLRNALNRDPNTHVDPGNPRRSYNGIIRTTIPAEFLRYFQGVIMED